MQPRRNQLLGSQNNLSGYLFLLPLLVVFLVFFGFSVGYLFWSSFHKITLSFKNPQFVGWGNYSIVLQDPQFYTSLLNSFLLSFAGITVALTLGFLIAVFASFSVPGRRFFLSLFFVPSMVPMAFIAVVFGNMLEYTDGTINVFARNVGLTILDQHWLSDPQFSMLSVMAVSIYIIGIPIMYYTSDIATLDSAVFEAARIDGANLRQIVLLVMHPMLKATHQSIVLSLLLVGFREMERVYLMTDGGPGGSTEIIGTYVYHNIRFSGSNLGIAAAVGVLVLVIAVFIPLIQRAASRNREGQS